MRRLGIAVHKNISLRTAPIPDHGAREIQTPRRRLGDDIERIFHRARAAGLEEAADLLALLEKWDARPATRHGYERRVRKPRPRAPQKEQGRSAP